MTRFRASTASIEAMTEIHQGLLETVLSNAEEVYRARHPEALHDSRVAVRRTRSALTQIKGVYPPEAVAHFSREFKWFGSRTGPLRDLDVFLLIIPDYERALGTEGPLHLDPLVRLLREKRRREVRRLRSFHRSRRLERLLTQWEQFLADPGTWGPEGPLARHPIQTVSSDRVLARFGKIQRKTRKLTGPASAEALHRIRIDCKKLRYLLTFFQGLYPPEGVDPLMGELRILQDHLGRLNDLRVQCDTLAGLAQELVDSGAAAPPTMIAVGRLMGRLETERSRELQSSPQALNRFFGKEIRDRFQRLFQST